MRPFFADVPKGILIVVTTHNFKYLMYMIPYLIALPIWNFLLPLYAFANFDDFTWGSTRQLDQIHSNDDSSVSIDSLKSSELRHIPLKKWINWELEHRELAGSAETANDILMSAAKSRGYTAEQIERLQNRDTRDLSQITKLIGSELTSKLEDNSVVLLPTATDKSQRHSILEFSGQSSTYDLVGSYRTMDEGPLVSMKYAPPPRASLFDHLSSSVLNDLEGPLQFAPTTREEDVSTKSLAPDGPRKVTNVPSEQRVSHMKYFTNSMEATSSNLVKSRLDGALSDAQAHSNQISGIYSSTLVKNPKRPAGARPCNLRLMKSSSSLGGRRLGELSRMYSSTGKTDTLNYVENKKKIEELGKDATISHTQLEQHNSISPKSTKWSDALGKLWRQQEPKRSNIRAQPETTEEDRDEGESDGSDMSTSSPSESFVSASEDFAIIDELKRSRSGGLFGPRSPSFAHSS